MKEIDYITKNIDVKKFLGLIKKEGDTLLIEEIFDSVKNPNNKIRGLLKEYVFYGLFFNRVKKFITEKIGNIVVFYKKRNPYYYQ